jgi:hypothetical protein
MKSKIIFLFIVLNYTNINAQDKESNNNIEATKDDTNRFYYFEIPSSINGSNIDPTPISNITTNFTESKLSFKLGFPFIIKDDPKDYKDITYTGFLQPSFKATNGVSTLYKADSAPLEYGITGGVSLKISHKYWVFLDKNEKLTERRSSESIWWANFIGGNYNLFTSTEPYGELLVKESELNSSFYISINNYFYSKISRYKISNRIFSIGVGYAKTNNYNSLKTRTFEQGVIRLNTDNASSYQSVSETISGKEGKLIVYEGISAFAELYIPLVRNPKYGGIYFGNRVTYFSLTNDNIVNGITGFYFNLKDKKVDGEKPGKDILNFSVTGQFNQLNNSSNPDYFNKNFSIVLQAAIPIRFN